MIRASRRQTLLGALLVPAAAGLPGIAAARGQATLLLHDPDLKAGQRLAQVHGGEVLAIEGDRIRFARAVFARRPSLVIGVSRPVDALLIVDVAREAGYVPVEQGTGALREMIAGWQGPYRGLALGWVLAPRG